MALMSEPVTSLQDDTRKQLGAFLRARRESLDHGRASRGDRHHDGHRTVENGEKSRALQKQHVKKRRDKEDALRHHARARHRQNRRRQGDGELRAGVETPHHVRVVGLSEQSPHV